MLQDAQNEIVLYYLAGTIFILLLVSAIIFYIFLHQKKVNAFRLHLQQEEMKKQEAIYSALQEGEEKERNRIAEELHDGVSAKLSGLNMNLDYLRSKIGNPEAEVLIEKTFTGIRDIINELRELSHNLHPTYFLEKDIQLLLINYIDQLNSKNECFFELYYEVDLKNIDKTIKLHCYRIITELLHNVYKHAKATKASVQILKDEINITMIVEDNGKGFKSDAGNFNGVGLSNIRNRVSISKGILNIDSSEKGTTIIIELPI